MSLKRVIYIHRSFCRRADLVGHAAAFSLVQVDNGIEWKLESSRGLARCWRTSPRCHRPKKERTTGALAATGGKFIAALRVEGEANQLRPKANGKARGDR